MNRKFLVYSIEYEDVDQNKIYFEGHANPETGEEWGLGFGANGSKLNKVEVDYVLAMFSSIDHVDFVEEVKI